MKFALVLTLIAAPVLADTPLGADAFEDLVEGKTLTFSNASGPYGLEYYAPNRQVIWSYIGGSCQRGYWYEVPTDFGPSICFDYENDPELHCWHVFDYNGQIRAGVVGSTDPIALYQLTDEKPLVCGGVGT